jgi:hypothetical protein
MGPCEDLSTPPENQDTRGPDTGGPARTKGCRDGVHRPRSRVCLLKGCERTFRPQHPLTRYCSEACRQQARRWREWKARRRYRQSRGCKQKRRAQSRRYRERRRAKDRKTPSAGNARVIPMKFFSCSCDRPGCYDLRRSAVASCPTPATARAARNPLRPLRRPGSRHAAR